jgi:hypothetical protein
MRIEAAAHGSTCTCRAGFVRAGAGRRGTEDGRAARGMWRRQEGGDTSSARMTMIVLSVFLMAGWGKLGPFLLRKKISSA